MDTVEESCKVLSISHQCSLLGISRSQQKQIQEYGYPAIFNTDQGSQFTSEVFQNVLADHHIQARMDGKGRALDNIRIERLWRSLKYEDIYLKRYETMGELMKCMNPSSTTDWNINRLYKLYTLNLRIFCVDKVAHYKRYLYHS